MPDISGAASSRPCRNLAHNNGAGPSATIAPELCQAMENNDAPRDPVDAFASQPPAVVQVVAKQLEALFGVDARSPRVMSLSPSR